MPSFQAQLQSANPHESFDGAAGWEMTVDGWQLAVDGGHVSASTDSVADATTARVALARIMRGWQAAAFLRDQHDLTFAPSSPDAQELQITPLFGEREHVYRRANAEYPRPDDDFRISPLVERLLATLAGFVAGSADLVATAADMLGQLDSGLSDGDPGTLAAALNADPRVIVTLRELVARGTGAEADRHSLYRGPEWQWLQEALRLVTLQAGRRRDDSPPRTHLGHDAFAASL